LDLERARVPCAAKVRFLADGDLDSEQVRSFLLASSREDDGTGGVPVVSTRPPRHSLVASKKRLE
jgi:hypothetical protein